MTIVQWIHQIYRKSCMAHGHGDGDGDDDTLQLQWLHSIGMALRHPQAMATTMATATQPIIFCTRI